MEKWSLYFSIGLLAFIIIGFLSGSLNRYTSIWGFVGGWLFMTCLIGIPAVEIYYRFFSREKKEESEKVE